jgi:hypothetical protein
MTVDEVVYDSKSKYIYIYIYIYRNNVNMIRNPNNVKINI